MIVFRVQLSLSPACRSQVVCSLRRGLGRTRALRGCVSCHLCTDVEDDSRVLLIEEWADVQSFRARVRSDGFRVVLSALDYASGPPEVRFDTIANTQGMEFIVACREGRRPD